METGKTGLETMYTERYAACFELFLKHGGRNFLAIERGMRDLGYKDFHRRILYTRKENGIEKPGWVEKFGWWRFLKPALIGGNTTGRECVSGRTSQSSTGISEDAALPPRAEGVDPGIIPPGADTLPTGRVSAPASPQSFPDWLKQVSPELTWDWPYQKYIYKHLQRITDGTLKRLMIFMPPRHGKSELVTVRYAGWRLWNDPKMKVIVSSYNQKLADKFSRSIRKLLSEEEDKRAAAAAPPLAERKGSAFTRATPKDTGGCASADAAIQHPADYPQCPGGGIAADHIFEPAGKAEPFRSARGGAAETTQPDNSAVHTVEASQPDNSALRTPHSAFARMFPRTRTINTASQWETALGGGVKAVGVGAGVTGFGGQLIVIDDPVKSRAEAESETYREKLWDWYRNDLYTRLEPGAAVILIQTRWHQDDLAGRLLQEMKTGGDQWEVIDLPALSEPRAVATGLLSVPPALAGGFRLSPTKESIIRSVADLSTESDAADSPNDEKNPPAHAGGTDTADPLGRPIGKALCPDRFDEAKLADIQRQLGSYNFSALYQQQPTPAEGGIFKRAWFNKFVHRAPEGLKWKRGYDLAVSTKTNSCFTASLRVARDEATGNIYIADGFRERIEYPDQKRYIIGRLMAETDTEHGIEKALHGQALIQDLRRETKVFGKNLRGIDVTADKVTRALTWAPLAEEGKVILVHGDWNRAFLDEVANFPSGEHDDQIDAVSLAVSMLETKGRKVWGF